MKKSLIFLIFLTISFMASGQYIVGNPLWKWDTITTFDEGNNMFERYTQTCDVNGNILQQLVESRDDGSWKNYYRSVMGYENGIMKTATSSVWTGAAWIEVRRITASYDIAKRITSELIETRNLSNWTNSKRRNYSYDAMGRKSRMLQETWKNNAWINDMVNNYEYNSQGHLYRIVTQYADGGPWENGMRLTYTTDDNGYYLVCSVESFETGQWLVIGKMTYTHDQNGNILSELVSSGDGTSWVDEMYTDFTYDENNNGITGMSYAWIGSSWGPAAATSYVYYGQDYLLVFLHNAYRWEASYKHFPLGLDELNPVALRIYPNPATSYLTIDYPDNAPLNVNGLQSIQLYNVSGTLVKSIPAANTPVIIDVSEIPSGTYLIKERRGRHDFTGKVIISH